MGISLISISHRVAPLAIRELFAFPEEQQCELMRQAVSRGIAAECILISTCNRTEIYTYSDREESNFTRVQELLLEFAEAADVENIGDYIRLYSDSGAVTHLFRVAAGLDSMVMGEDQILGQVKRAHDQARRTGTCGVYLNTLFRFAVTAAKKVKTETELSRTTVSTATMAIKAAEQGLGTLKGKNVMIIGASGKIGSTVLKNLQCIEGVRVFLTSRNMAQAHKDHHHKIAYQVMEYENRYDLADDMDVIISATSSPHYTLTYEKLTNLCNAVRAGLPYIATHPDLNCPVAGGYIPDIGATIAYVEAATGRRPDAVIGKPNRFILQAAARRFGCQPEEICMVGDRLYTDIALGRNGCKTVLVLCGESGREDLPGAVHQPDLVCQDLLELCQVWQKSE